MEYTALFTLPAAATSHILQLEAASQLSKRHMRLKMLFSLQFSVAGGWAGICRSLGTGTLQTVCSTAAPRAQRCCRTPENCRM